MDKFERRRQALARLKEKLGWGAIAKIAAAIGKEPSYVSRMLYPEGKQGRKRIGEDTAELLTRHFPDWLGEVEGDDSAANASPLESAEMVWPFPSIPEKTVRALGDADLRRLEGAIALAIAQLSLKMEVAPALAAPKAKPQPIVLPVEQAANDPGYVAIPLKKIKIRAGVAGFSLDQTGNGTAGAVYVPRAWLAKRGINPEVAFASHVGGMSMWPRVQEGDVVVVNPGDTERRNGIVYAFNHDGEFVLKRLKKQLNRWYLTSDNPDKTQFPPVHADEATFMIGRAVLLQAEEI
ncbi:MAG: S24 family peptidase [Alcaligenaceae bacterium]|nr:S24 family peptidase [Alcaligenaceae bacterium SAGV5]MPS50421.1 S24 family peptidase [Alcaligenaceae bacterium SAGV3]MPT57918.1 S24 family peptidase [Alcaligenaceae bacterium]